MNTEEIIKGNCLIAEFMGMKHLSTHFDSHGFEQYSWSVSNDISKQVYGYEGATCFLDEEQFYTSWDWLIPVVEKIESIEDKHHGHFGVHIISNSCSIQATNFRSQDKIANPPHYFAEYTLTTKIVSTWIAVIEFINWHNQNK